jgi:hypothetical protein
LDEANYCCIIFDFAIITGAFLVLNVAFFHTLLCRFSFGVGKNITSKKFSEMKKPTALFATIMILSSLAIYNETPSSSVVYGEPTDARMLDAPTAAADTCQKLPTANAVASGNDGNLPANAIDNNLNTRWSNLGIASWIQTDLGEQKTICSVDIAWYNGNVRQSNFVISVSNDGSTFTNVFTGKSSGTTLSPESYNLPANTVGRFVRITVNGNTQNNWASITEIAVNGFGGTSPPPTNHAPVVDNINDVPVQITNPPTPVSVTLMGRDADNDPLTFEVVQVPTKGTVTSTGPNTIRYSLDPSVQSDTTDSFTYRANDGKAGGVSNIGTVTLKITVQSQDPGVDKFGIKKIYPTKSVGGKTEEWYMNMDNPTNDARTSPPSMTKNSDGSWKVTSGQVRYGVYTSTGYHPGQISTLNQAQMEAKGYMQSPNDWKNLEMTGIVKFVSGDSTDQWTWYARGGRHTGSGYPLGCEGTALKPMLYYDGKVRFAKEQWHVSYVFTGTKSSPANNIGKFVGFKSVMYNFQQSGKTVVKLETWVDLNPDSATGRNQWQKVNEFVDSGGWGSSAGECGGKPDQIITWGGPTATFRWDNANNVSIKNLSVREIVPPQ